MKRWGYIKRKNKQTFILKHESDISKSQTVSLKMFKKSLKWKIVPRKKNQELDVSLLLVNLPHHLTGVGDFFYYSWLWLPTENEEIKWSVALAVLLESDLTLTYLYICLCEDTNWRNVFPNPLNLTITTDKVTNPNVIPTWS